MIILHFFVARYVRHSGNKVILSCKTGHSIQGQSRLLCKGGEEERRRGGVGGGEDRAIEKKKNRKSRMSKRRRENE